MAFKHGQLIEAFLLKEWQRVTYVKPCDGMRFCLSNLKLAPCHRVQWLRSTFEVGEDDLRAIESVD